MKSKRFGFVAIAIIAMFATLSLASTHGAVTRIDAGASLAHRGTALGAARLFKSPISSTKPQLANLSALRELRFEPNRGQTDSKVKFIGRGSGYTLFLSTTEAAFAIPKPVKQPVALRLTAKERRAKLADPAFYKPQPIEYSLLRMKLAGARPNASLEAMDKLPGKINYFIGNDPKKWRRNIPIYSRVKVHNVYPGIDLVYHGGDQRHAEHDLLEYDLVVAPGADPSAIKISFAGADSMRLDSHGDLRLSVGGRDFVQRAPVVYQDIAGAKKTVAGHYRLSGVHSTTIQLAAYDRAAPLLIDPALVWATYLGGTQNDQINGVATRPNNGSDNVYVTGNTGSMDLAVKASPELSQLVGGEDAFVAELSHDSATIIYFSYLGGSDQNEGNGIAVDPSGNAYIVGRTFSSNFPTTVGAKDTSCCDGWSGAFVSKILFDGSNLAYSTFIRGRPDMSGMENGRNAGLAIAVDPHGNAYATGWTDSIEFPTKSGNPNTPVFQGSNGGINAGMNCAGDTCTNAWVTEVNQDGSDYVFSTYLGGEAFTRGLAITVQGTRPMPTAPEVYTPFVAGETSDLMFPVTPNAFEPMLGNGSGLGTDAFVTEVKSDGTALLYSTYLGDGAEGPFVAAGGGPLAGIAVTLDTTFPDRKMVCVTGVTSSANFPVCGVNGIECTRATEAFQVFTPQVTAAAYVTCFDFDGNAIPANGTGTGLCLFNIHQQHHAGGFPNRWNINPNRRLR